MPRTVTDSFQVEVLQAALVDKDEVRASESVKLKQVEAAQQAWTETLGKLEQRV